MASEATSLPGWRRLEARALGGSPLAHGFSCRSDVPDSSQAGSPGQPEGHRGTLPSSESWAGFLMRKEHTFAAAS